MHRITKDSWAGAVVCALGLALVLVTPSQVTGDQLGRVGSATMPQALAYVMAALGATLFFASLRPASAGPAPDRAATPNQGRLLFRVLAALAFVAITYVYILLIPGLGYVVATALLIAALMVLFGERRWWLVVVLAILLPLGLQLFFEKVMVIYLPGAQWI
jgi:hypothetical protein